MKRCATNMVFLTCLWYSLNTLGSVLEGGAFLNMSTMFEKSMEAKTISNLEF